MRAQTRKSRIEYHLLGVLAITLLAWLCWIGPPQTAFLAFTALGPAWYCCHLRGQTRWTMVLTAMWFAALIRCLMLPLSAV